MATAPTLPTWIGGAIATTQLNAVNAGVSFASGLAQKLANIAIMSAIGTASLAASTSASYVDISGTGGSWTKIGDSSSSDVLVLLALSAFASAVPTGSVFGIAIGGTDYDIVAMTFNAASTHTPFVGFRAIAGVAAGSYTPKVRFKRASGSGSVAIDTGDTASWLIGELPK